MSEIDLSCFEIIENPYMPEGFILMAGYAEWVVLNTKTGYVFTIPKFPKFEIKSEFKGW